MTQHLMIQHLMTSKGQNGNSLKCILFAIQSIGGYTVPPCFHQLPFQSPVSILFHNSLARLFEGHQFSVCSIPSFMITGLTTNNICTAVVWCVADRYHKVVSDVVHKYPSREQPQYRLQILILVTKCGNPSMMCFSKIN